MSERSVDHETFVIERTYDANPSRVFAAWAEREAKARWFGGGADVGGYELDFRVGGREFSSGTVPGGESSYTFEARYQDIVTDQRIVYTYEMHIDGQRISVSLGTVELAPDGDGTRLTYTEQGAFLDGLDNAAQRQQGTGSLLDALGEELQRQEASA